MADSGTTTLKIRIKGEGITLTAKQMKQLTAQAQKMAAGAKRAGDSVNFMRIKTAGLRRTLGEIRNQLLVFTFALGGLIRFMNKSIEAYKKQWQATQKLAAAMRNVESNTRGSTAALIAYAAELQNVTTYGDEVIMDGMAMLSTFQLNALAIKEVTPRMLDMAAAVQVAGGDVGDLNAVAIALGKGLTGQVGILARYGIVIDKAGLAMARAKGRTAEFNFVLGELDKNFKGIAEQLATSSIGQIAQYENKISDAMEKIGKASLPVKKAWTEIKLSATQFLATLAVIKANQDGDWSWKGIRAMVEEWKAARKEVLGLLEDPIIDLPEGFHLTEDQLQVLSRLNKEFEVELSWLKSIFLMNDGIISQNEQMILIKTKMAQLEHLHANGLLELTDYQKKLNDLIGEEYVLFHQLSPEVQYQVDLMRQMSSAMASAAVSGQNMGKAIANAIKQIAAQLAASLVVFGAAKLLGFDIGFLMRGGGADRFVGGLLGVPNHDSRPSESNTQQNYNVTVLGDFSDETAIKLAEAVNGVNISYA